ncbi:MAG TPA: peptide chain release factor 1 [Myxococcota bacterium]|nr:peptide chain release factor 1 [Myxococcota bacterium]
MSDLRTTLDEVQAKAAPLEERLQDPELARSPAEYARVAKELAALRPLLTARERWGKLLDEIESTHEMLQDEDPELREMAQGEHEALVAERDRLEEEIRDLLVPQDPNDEKDVILEIRAGAGGDEAALFAGDLYRMYARYAEERGWKLETLSASETGTGGMKEIVCNIRGDRVYSRLKHESGVHRVQRVPVTESQGRIHTSTATVAVLPEAEEMDLQIEAKDLRIDVFRASGPGGQSVNTTDSAVRITHVPTGVVVQCQDEKSQHKNKARAMKILRSRIYEAEQARLAAERAGERRSQVGTGDRSERIRTYNFPQSRITDHRAGVTLHGLETVLDGDLDELLDGVAAWYRSQQEAAA